ncbi:MAG: mechanosensitive ion channel [Symploca sp. SIO2C1]|nr:mechanosensitive ion channel [Symploca sp. SIO2C1]
MLTWRSHFQLKGVLIVFTAIIALLLLLSATPTQAHLTVGTTKAPVVIDGKVLFEVGELEDFSAEERAEQANTVLDEEIESGKPIQAKILIKDKLPTIRINDHHLLTVTKGDVISGVEPAELSKDWQQKIESGIEQAKYERTPAYQSQALITSLGVLALAIATHFGLWWLCRHLPSQWVRWLGRASTSHDPGKIVSLVLVCLQLGLWVGVVFYLTGLFPWFRHWRYLLISNFRVPIFTQNENSYSIWDLLVILLAIITLWLVVRWLTQLLKKSPLLQGADRGVQETVAILVQYILTGLGLIIILQIRGLDVSSLAIFASVLGVGIGFGLQNLANNFVSGLVILLERPIRVGDFVNVGDLVGTVERIGSRSTEIRTLDQVTIIVPNSHFLEKEVVNWNHGDPVSRLHLSVGVAYGSNIKKVRAAILDAAIHHPEVLGHPQPQVWFMGFGDNSLDFELLVWNCDPPHQFRLKSDLYYQIEASLRRYGIEIPFPQRDLNVRSPQLEEALATWMKQQSSPPKQLYYPDGVRVIESSDPADAEELIPEYLIPTEQKNLLERVDLDALVKQMRGDGGLEIIDRKYRLKFYRKCFVGFEAVKWLMKTQKATQVEAIRLGQMLVEQKIIHHVEDQHSFKDGYLFYRFYIDEDLQSPNGT